MRGVIIQDQLDGGIRGISGIEQLEEIDELARPVALLDTRMHLASQQVDPGEQAQCAMALVFVVARKALMLSRLRRQVGCGVGDRLDAGLLVVGNEAWFKPRSHSTGLTGPGADGDTL